MPATYTAARVPLELCTMTQACNVRRWALANGATFTFDRQPCSVVRSFPAVVTLPANADTDPATIDAALLKLRSLLR